MNLFNKSRRKFTCLHNEMDTREGYSLNRSGICGQMGYNKKTCETRQHILFFYIYFKLCQL